MLIMTQKLSRQHQYRKYRVLGKLHGDFVYVRQKDLLTSLGYPKSVINTRMYSPEEVSACSQFISKCKASKKTRVLSCERV